MKRVSGLTRLVLGAAAGGAKVRGWGVSPRGRDRVLNADRPSPGLADLSLESRRLQP